ncbi:MAG: hypothetical protein JXQ71_01660 [Verrucomicrobia bacterium]|nr:hypothetical protein [Verrucomicrobiota bacterium]
MTIVDLKVRRATIEDLPQLTALWKAEGLPADRLDKRFQEFQVAAAGEGSVSGALGLQIAGSEGRVHSEVFAHPEQADALRELLLERLRVVMRNHGLCRAWTQLASPFWHRNGFQPAGQELLARLPPAFQGDPAGWSCLTLREDTPAAAISLEKEFALFREAEKQQTERMYRQAKALRVLAVVIAVGVLVLILGFLGLVVLRNRARQPRVPGAGSARALPVLAGAWCLGAVGGVGVGGQATVTSLQR